MDGFGRLDKDCGCDGGEDKGGMGPLEKNTRHFLSQVGDAALSSAVTVATLSETFRLLRIQFRREFRVPG
jgi:hypothetical protein